MTAILCIKGAYFYDNTESIELPMPKEVIGWKEKVQNMPVISTYGPIIVMAAIEFSVTKNLRLTFKSSIKRLICSLALYIGLIYLWFIPQGPEYEDRRHVAAKFEYIGSFIVLIIETWLKF